MDTSNKPVVRGRYFNTFEYTAEGYLKKSSTNSQKILDEIYWYKNIPEEIAAHTAALQEANTTTSSPYYSLLYYHLPSLADLYINNSLPLSQWDIIMRDLLQITTLFNSYSASISMHDMMKMYSHKTIKRLELLQNNSYWQELFSRKSITINNKHYASHTIFLTMIEEYVRSSLFTQKHMSIIHGDLCLSNILYDESKRKLILLDPRGRWYKQSIYGDIKYDIAKLRHSFCGYYDFIMNDVFSLSEGKVGEFTLSIKTNTQHKHISDRFDGFVKSQGYELMDIMFIECLLFLSMIPLHEESIERQKTMYLTGVMLLNEHFYE